MDNMVQMHPRRVAELVESGELESAITANVKMYLEAVQRMKERAPQMPDDAIQEIAQAEYLTPVNPTWQDENRLTKEEKTALKAYLKSLK